MGKRWYAARTQAGLTHIAQRELEKPYGDREAFRTLLPCHDGRPVFGPYIFIEFDVERDYWEPINGVRGISRLLPVGCPTPLSLPGDFIDDLRERLALGKFGPEEAERFVYAWTTGELGVVTSGAWEGHRGPFVSKSKGFINLSMVLFGRAFKVPIPSHQVKPAGPITTTKGTHAPQYGRRERTSRGGPVVTP
jgi:hypothetical protein